MNALTMADIEAELREEVETIKQISGIVPDLDYIYLDGLKHGMIAAMCLQNGWTELPPAERTESLRLQEWLIGLCAERRAE